MVERPARFAAARRRVDKLSALRGLAAGACVGGAVAFGLGHAPRAGAYVGAGVLLVGAGAFAAPDLRRARRVVGAGAAVAALAVVAEPVVGAGVARGWAAVTAKAACPAGMVLIPGGTFQMGDADEKPVHAVSVPGFCLDATDVTAAAYEACVKEGKCSGEHLNESSADGKSFAVGKFCNYEVDGKGNHPINCVDWSQSKAYCEARGWRLPTEEEWEYAARGGEEQRTYPWGNEPLPGNQLCWNGEGNDLGKGKRSGTCEVGSYPAGVSRWGAQDMAGNVWQWTASPYCPYSSSCTDERRVVRGGSWSNGVASLVRAAYRNRGAPVYRADYVGFRCARTPQ